MKKDKNRKLRGSVLLTVVFVMSILIIFLFGTLALALAANNRAHVNYSSAQTGITARAVAESAIKAISNSSQTGRDYAAAVDALTPDSDPITVPVKLSGDGIGSLGDVEPVVISYAGTKMYYDPDKVEWQKRDLLRFTATVNMAGVQKQSSVYVLKLDKDDAVESSGGGAGFVTTAGATFKTQTSLYGGSYINLPNVTDASTYNYDGSYEERMKSRVFRDESGNKTTPHELWNSGAIIEADLVINNDLEIENWSGFVFPGEGKGVTIWGDMYFNQPNAGDHLGYECSKEIADGVAFNKVPYLYVDGDIYGNKGVVKIGEDGQNFPLNTFCGTINAGNVVKKPGSDDYETDGGAASVLASNIYCMDEGRKSAIRGVKNPGLFTWAKSVVSQLKNTTPNTVVNGEICSKGDLELSNVTIKGDVRVEGKLILTGKNDEKVTVNGVVVCNEIEGAERLVCSAVYTDDGNGGTPVKNLVGYYYEYTPQPSPTNTNVYVGLDGNVLNDEKFTDGVPNEGVIPNDLRIHYTLEYGVKPEDVQIVNEGDYEKFVIETAPVYYSDSNDEEYKKSFAKAEDIEPGKKGFYFETSLVPFEPGKHPGKDPGDVKPGEAKPHDQFVRIGGKAFERVPGEAKALSDTFKFGAKTVADFKSEYKTDTIYPKYAERKTVLGRDASLNKEETKIVLTLDEVLKDINPYDEDLPADVMQNYDKLNKAAAGSEEAKYIFSSQDDINKMFCVTEAYSTTADKGTALYNVSSDGNNWKTYYKHISSDYTKTVDDKKELDAAAWSGLYSANSAATFISGNCILDGVSFSNGKGDVIIDPKGKSIVIGIRGNVSFQSGVQILVADGGKVYFYLEEGASLDFDKNNLCTNTYWQKFKESKNFSYMSTPTKPNTVKIEDLKIGELSVSCPNVYVYAAKASTQEKRSKLTITNMPVMTMNVISSDIVAHIKGTEGKLIDSLLYNDYETIDKSKQYIIGCFNVNDATIDNTVNVVYIPDGNNGEQVTGTADNTYKCKVLYYSEF